MEKPAEKKRCVSAILPESLHQQLVEQVAKEIVHRKNRKKRITVSTVICRALEEYLNKCQKA